MSFRYDVCLSFAGEDRTYVEQVAEALLRQRLRVFYDKYEEVELWAKDLYRHLADVYQRRAQYCVVFASSAYASKLWTRRELESAQARALAESREYILLARFDDTEIPGVLSTTGYVDLRFKTPLELANLIAQKVATSSPRPPIPVATSSATRLPPKRLEDTYDVEKQARRLTTPPPESRVAPVPSGHARLDSSHKIDFGALPSSLSHSGTLPPHFGTASSRRRRAISQFHNSQGPTLKHIARVAVRCVRQRLALVSTTGIVATIAFLAVDGNTNVAVENMTMASGIIAVVATVVLPLTGFPRPKNGGG